MKPIKTERFSIPAQSRITAFFFTRIHAMNVVLLTEN